MSHWRTRGRDLWGRIARSGFPFMPGSAEMDPPMRRVRHQARRAFFAERSPLQQLALQAAMVIAWPLCTARPISRQLRRLAPVDRPSGWRSWLRRGQDMAILALRENVTPREYCAYRLHDPERRARIGDFVFWPELRSLLDSLNRTSRADIGAVMDKGRFARLCRDHHLPCIPTLAVYAAGRQTGPADPFIPSQPALWVKDIAGSRGSGAACWRRCGEGYRLNGQGPLLSPQALRDLWSGRNCIVQPCLESHPDLATLSDGALLDFRVVTGLGRDGAPAIIACQAQLPHGGEGAISRRTIFAPVDLDGRIGHPTAELSMTAHPDTGRIIEGTQVPFWNAALELVSLAHREVPEFSRFAFLGWDVAITGDGPLLIEANHGWGCITLQSGNGEPLGATAFLRIALDRMEQQQEDAAPCD